MQRSEQLLQYAYLMRLNKPIGILLLLWPTLWALWLASHGRPQLNILFIFLAGVVLMRSAGCIMNDVADRHVDGHVARTRQRPLATDRVSVRMALLLAGVLALLAFSLVLFCNTLTIGLALVGAVLATGYPYLKRVTHLPQCGLGVAFAWGIPMAFAAETGRIGWDAWFVFLTAVLWPIIYDTMYAMVDRDDDRRVGIKSTAILLGHWDRWIIGLLQCVFVLMLIGIGKLFQLHASYYVALIVTSGLFLYQQWLIKDRHLPSCFYAFLNNNWVGFVIFIGIVASYL